MKNLSSLLTRIQHAFQMGISYRKSQIRLRKCRSRISIRGPTIWKNLIGKTEKEIQSSFHFKTKITSKLLNFENQVTFLLIPLLLKNSLTEATTDDINVL